MGCELDCLLAVGESMNIRLPKPLHGWRAFSGEVGIIVLGVLLALGAGQLAEVWNKRAEARNAEAAIKAELALNGGVLAVRGMTAACRQQQLAQVATLITGARSTGQLPDVDGIRSGSTAPILTTAWDTAVSDGTASDIEAKRRGDYALIYYQIAMFRSAIDEENRLLTHVRLLQDSPGRISDALNADIATSAAELEAHVRLDDVLAEQTLIAMRHVGIEANYGYYTGAPGTVGNGNVSDVRTVLAAAGMIAPRCNPVLADGVPVSSEAQKSR